jgi:hypothetical protein
LIDRRKFVTSSIPKAVLSAIGSGFILSRGLKGSDTIKCPFGPDGDPQCPPTHRHPQDLSILQAYWTGSDLANVQVPLSNSRLSVIVPYANQLQAGNRLTAPELVSFGKQYLRKASGSAAYFNTHAGSAGINLSGSPAVVNYVIPTFAKVNQQLSGHGYTGTWQPQPDPSFGNNQPDGGFFDVMANDMSGVMTRAANDLINAITPSCQDISRAIGMDIVLMTGGAVGALFAPPPFDAFLAILSATSFIDYLIWTGIKNFSTC